MAGRLEYADYAKAVAIFLVVLGHTNGAYVAGRDWMYLDFCYAFHMPLFFMLSGFFIRPKASYSRAGWRRFLAQNFLALMVPYFIWGVIYMPFSYPNLGRLAYGSWLQLRAAGTLTSLWFLPVMFVGRVLCEGVLTLAGRLRLSHGMLCAVAIPVFAALGFLLPHHNALDGCVGNVWNCDVGVMAAAFMMLGALARPFADRLAKAGIAKIAAVFAAGFFLERPLLTAGRDMTMLMCNAEYGPWAYCLANALSGSVMTLSLAMLLARFVPSWKPMLFVGANTMGVYLIHKPLQNDLIAWGAHYGLVPNDLCSALVFAVPAFLLSVGIVVLFLRVAPALFGKARHALGVGEVLAVAFGEEGTLRTVEDKTLSSLLAEFERLVTADGKVDFAEASMLLRFIAPIAEQRGGAYGEFRDLLVRTRTDGRIDADESAAIIEKLRGLIRK